MRRKRFLKEKSWQSENFSVQKENNVYWEILDSYTVQSGGKDEYMTIVVKLLMFREEVGLSLIHTDIEKGFFFILFKTK